MNILKRLNVALAVKALVEIVLGLWLVCSPNSAILTVCYVAGILLLLSGASKLVERFAFSFDNSDLADGILRSVGAILLLIFAQDIASSGFFGTVAALVLTVLCCLKVKSGLFCKAQNVQRWWLYIVDAAVLLVLALLLFFNPWGGQTSIVILLGITLLLDGVLDLVSACVAVKENDDTTKQV